MTHMMKLFVALALAAAPSARGMAPYATDSELVRDPRPLRPRARKRRIETQAFAGSITFKCYGADVMVFALGTTTCP